MSTDSGPLRDPKTTGGKRPVYACTAAIFGGGGGLTRAAPVVNGEPPVNEAHRPRTAMGGAGSLKEV